MMLQATVAALAATLVTGTQATASTVTEVHTQQPIVAFAHDNGWIAWETEPCNGGTSPHPLHIRSMVTGARAVIGLDPFCERPVALGGDRAVWVNEDKAGGGIDTHVATASVSDPTQRVLQSYFQDYYDGTTVPAVSGDGTTLAYTEFSYKEATDGCFCDVRITGGASYRVVAGHRVAIPGAPGAVMLSVSGDQVALVPVVVGSPYGPAEAGRPVEVRNVVTGALTTSFSPVGEIRSISMNGSLVAVLVRAAGGDQTIQRYDATTGTLVASSSVASDVAGTIDMSGAGILFRRGRALILLSRTTGSRSLVTTLRRVPVRFSIEGRTVVWAVNLDGDGYIRRRGVTAQ